MARTACSKCASFLELKADVDIQVWMWTADHDIEDPALTEITIYNGRGLYIESTAGNIWL